MLTFQVFFSFSFIHYTLLGYLLYFSDCHEQSVNQIYIFNQDLNVRVNSIYENSVDNFVLPFAVGGLSGGVRQAHTHVTYRHL